ncbi:MAG: MATE family efflux transporter [Erysipelotrichaceae bacterium]
MVNRKIGNNLTEGSIIKGLLLFAIPIVLTNLIQQLYSLVDLIVIGQFVGNAGTVGVNTGGEMADLVTPVAMGFSTAGQIYIAQLFGAKQNDTIKKTVGTLLTFMLGLSVLLGIVMIIFSKPILGLLNCPMEAIGQAMSYMIITAVGYPFIFGYNAVVGILRGMGESKKPLYFIIVAAVVNIVLDLILVAGFKMEAAGTAIATVASQIGSFMAAFYFMYKKREQFDFEVKLSYFKMDTHILKTLVKLGIPQVVRSMFVRMGMLWVNSNVNAYGIVVSTTNSVGNKLQKFLEVFIQGIDTASASMIGQNLGARKIQRASKTTLCTVCLTLGCAVISTVLCLTIPHTIFGVFTNDQSVIELGVLFLRIFCIHFFASAITGSFQAMVTGCGFVELGFIIGLFDGLICKIGFGILFTRVFGMGYEGIWLGVACSRIIPGMICMAYFFSGKWKTRKLLTD